MNGSPTAEVWQQVHDRLRSFIAGRVRHQADADDVLQEVFLRIHRRMEDLADPGRVVPWVYQITRHAIADYYRKPELRREMPAGSASDMESTGIMSAAPPDDRSADSAALRSELAGCLRPMLDRLPRDYREAVTLVELDGLTQQAAATRVGLSLSGMKSRVQRGRKQLKRMLDECCLIQLDRRGGLVDYDVRDVRCNPCSAPNIDARADK